MPSLSLRDAATAAHVSKSTILRAIQSGRLSAARLEGGGYAIDPAELFRVYPPRNASAPVQSDAVGQDTPPPAPDAPTSATEALNVQIEMLREMLSRADREAADLREDRDRWRSQAENAQRLITDQSTTAPRSWWRRAFG